MLQKTSLIIESIDARSKRLQKTLTDVNPSVGAVNLRKWAQQLNAITNNTYVNAYRVDRSDLSTAE